MERMLTAIKPTGQLTLGNYIGALKPLVGYQDDYELFVFIANLHTLTVYQEPSVLKKNLKDAVALYLACGLDPEKTTIFLQTDVLAQAQLGYIMACNTYLGELNRMTQFKDKQAKGETNLTAGLYTYPCLMSADILAYNPDYVPVGDDQKQHVELTRDVAIRMNNRYGELFKVPRPLIRKVGARIMSLSDPSKKMSKSEESNKGCIYLLDEPNVARKKIMSAVTDSGSEIIFDPEHKPGVSNLMQIYACLTNKDFKTIEAEFKDSNYGTFKRAVADVVVSELEIIQERYHDIIKNDIIDTVLNQGALKANHIALKTLHKVERRVGIEIKKR